MFYKLLFLGHRSLIKNKTQTTVINIVNKRILINLTFRILVNIHFQKQPLQFSNTVRELIQVRHHGITLI